MTFKVGDKVCWMSQAAGVWVRKNGVVIAVVPAGTVHKDAPKGSGRARDRESYLVRSFEADRGTGMKPESRTYWPLAVKLKRLRSRRKE